MKRILSATTSFLAAAVVCVSSCISAFAADKLEDFKADTSKASAVSDWGQSFQLEFETFDISRMTEDSKITVSYEMENDFDEAANPVELIFQSWEAVGEDYADKDGKVWAKISPSEFEEGKAVFEYDDIVDTYGTDDFSKVSCVHVGATDQGKITCTGFKVSKCAKTGERSSDEDENKETDSKAEEEVNEESKVEKAESALKAEGEVYTADTSSATAASDWNSSFKLGAEQILKDGSVVELFDASRMTADSQVVVTYTAAKETSSPVELIFQSWEAMGEAYAANDGGVWAKIAPVEFGGGQAIFNYADIVAAYGTEDFTKVSCILVGATDQGEITCTGMRITNIKDAGNRVYPEPVKAQAEVKKSDSPVFLIIGIVAGIALAVGVIILIMNKKSSETFDVTTGKFVSKKNSKK